MLPNCLITVAVCKSKLASQQQTKLLPTAADVQKSAHNSAHFYDKFKVSRDFKPRGDGWMDGENVQNINSRIPHFNIDKAIIKILTLKPPVSKTFADKRPNFTFTLLLTVGPTYV